MAENQNGIACVSIGKSGADGVLFFQRGLKSIQRLEVGVYRLTFFVPFDQNDWMLDVSVEAGNPFTAGTAQDSGAPKNTVDVYVLNAAGAQIDSAFRWALFVSLYLKP